VDPNKLSDPEKLRENAGKLRVLAQSFLVKIFDSVDEVPWYRVGNVWEFMLIKGNKAGVSVI
jgi:hypothetical protein